MVDLNSVARHLEDMVRHMPKKSELHVTFEVSTTVAHVVTDRGYLLLCLANLLSNVSQQDWQSCQGSGGDLGGS